MTLALGALVALLATPATASAQTTINPTRFDDPAVGAAGCVPQSCSLRQALVLANAPATTGPVTINLQQGTYFLQQPTPLEYPDAGKLTTVRGAGARLTTIDGRGLTRVLNVIEGGNAVLEDVAVAGGVANANMLLVPNFGGGIYVQGAGELALNRVAVSGNSAPSQGGGIYLDGDITIANSTIAANQVGVAGTGGVGAGMFISGAAASVTNSTVAGNAVVAGRLSAGGGIYSDVSSALQLTNVTLAKNSAATGGLSLATNSTATIANSIVASDTGPACNGAVSAIAGDHNLSDDASCGFTAVGDKQNVNPLLGALANNGGPTNTLAPAAASPAINAATGCPLIDQRGVARPQLGACDMGSYEYRTPVLTVITRVVNDNGSSSVPRDFQVHVRAGNADIAGSPSAGSAAGKRYTPAPGTYSVSEEAAPLYSRTFSGDCTTTGTVALAEGQSKTCMVTNNDKRPVVGKLINAEPKRGRVKFKLPGRKRFQTMREGRQLPIGTVVDTLNGRITLIVAANKQGKTAKADFYDGIFKIGQTKGRRPITVLTLVEKLTGCKTSKGKASAAAKKKKKKRRLWGDGKGRFRTKGKRSAATVVGTKWLVEDRCTSTLTKVARGRVEVRDFVKKKTVIVKKGKRYIARAR
jgi:predicted outer membrane repeat protein